MKREQPSFRELVKRGLTKDEQPLLKTAYDAIGDIAILEIDEGLRKKEKFIAESLLKCQKNIRTVLRKDSAHEGDFRTQKLKYLAGENKKETVHTESKARLKLDVEKVYFSPRMSNERLRIAGQVKDGENILVMFSGCAPYPVVIAKNTEAKMMTGIELNPVGHRYAVENVKLNKLNNVFLFKGDAREVVDRLCNRIIGLKSSIDPKQLQKRLRLKPELMEIHLHPEDLDQNLDKLEKTIQELKKKNIEVVLHAPMHFRGMEQNLSADNKEVVKNSVIACRMLEELCIRYSLHGFIAHAYTSSDKGRQYENKLSVLDKTLKENNFKKIILENSNHGEMADPGKISGLLKKREIRFCLDIVHLFQSRESDESFYGSIRDFSRGSYFHIADTILEKHIPKAVHAHEIGTGKIDFSRIVPYVDFGVIEVVSKDEGNPREMLDSYRKYHKMLKEYLDFDRIIMPLPREGESFLDVALKAARKGTTIHFYDFLHEDDFEQAKEKVRKACRSAKKRHKILGVVKCGQYSPRTFRICVDFRIL